ncbi:MAG: class I SAM-dependent methyltransferase [Candidatus Kryptoniota bacterium]
MTIDKKHWYDGWFYDRFVAPNQDYAFRLVKDMIHDGAVVLDVGTGTGRLLFQLADKCRKVDGIDPSIRNIERARSNISKQGFSGISVYHAAVEDFFIGKNAIYDYAILSYVVHEIDSHKREEILFQLSVHAEKIIVVDYAFPQPDWRIRAFNEMVEFAAGISHYRNFRSFLAGGGLPGLVERTDLEILKEIKNDPPGSHIIVLKSS